MTLPGRQALLEVQRYPEDFDGVIAGAPALDWTGTGAFMLRNLKAGAQVEATGVSVAGPSGPDRPPYQLALSGPGDMVEFRPSSSQQALCACLHGGL